MPRFDLHTHTNYSDGSFMHKMIGQAQKLGLDEIGFTDHCNVSTRKPMVKYRRNLGFNLDMTYKRRRQAINSMRQEFNIDIYDGVEMDFHPEDKSRIRKFLGKAEFDYVIGSVHHVDGINVMDRQSHKGKNSAYRRKTVDTYFEYMDQLIRSEVFDIAAHIDVFERNPYLRGKAEEEHYNTIVNALKRSDTITEINAGRALTGLEEFHPTPDLMKKIVDEGLDFAFGTDSHTPDQLEKRNNVLRKEFDELGIEPVRPAAIR